MSLCSFWRRHLRYSFPRVDGIDDKTLLFQGVAFRVECLLLQGELLAVLRNTRERAIALDGQGSHNVSMSVDDDGALAARQEDQVVCKELRSASAIAVVEQVVTSGVCVGDEIQVFRVIANPVDVIGNKARAVDRRAGGPGLCNFDGLERARVDQLVHRLREESAVFQRRTKQNLAEITVKLNGLMLKQ